MKPLTSNQSKCLKMTLVVAVITVLFIDPMYAQSRLNGVDAITTKINSIKESVALIMNVVAALVGLIGAVTCGMAWFGGKPDAGETTKKWVIGFAIVLCAALAADMISANAK